jgi:hypothetical protein
MYYRKRKRTLREKLTLPIVFLGLLSSGAYADAGTERAPVKRVTIQDMVNAANAMFWKPDPEVKQIVKIELVTVEVDGKTKQVYRPVDIEKAEAQQHKD